MADRALGLKQEILERVAQIVRARVEPGEAAAVQAFVQRYFRDVAPADLIEADPQDLYGMALAHWRFAGRHAAGRPAIRCYNPAVEQHGWQSRHTIVEIVNDDMPFLVDSVAMELGRHGLAIHLTIHPVIKVRRDADGRLLEVEPAEGGTPESFIHVEVDRLGVADGLDALERDLARVLGDVRAAVTDWRAMLACIEPAIAELRPAAQRVGEEELAELEEFLRWLAADHFTLLGTITHDLIEGEDGLALRRVPESGLGILKGQDEGISKSFAELAQDARRAAVRPIPPLVVTKANARSTVHRSTYLDVVSIKRFDAEGEVVGEHRLLGLFTSAAYSLSPRQIPLLRRKVATVLARSGFPPSGHAGKALANILDTYPRDELFQTPVDELERIAAGILQLQERQRLRLFVRADPFRRYVACLLFVPRERYNTGLREKLQAILEQALGGGDSEFQVQLSESVLARILFQIRTSQAAPSDVDIAALEAKLVAAAHSWDDQLKEALIETLGEAEGNRLARAYAKGLPIAYQEALPARAAVADVRALDRLAGAEKPALAMTLARRLEDPPDLLRFRVIRADAPIPLSDALPILENMGLRVLAEHPFTLNDTGGRSFALHEFVLRPITGREIDPDTLSGVFEEAFQAAWDGRIENDGFNRLVLGAGLGARRIEILRAYCKYLLQLGIPFSQAYLEQTLTRNAGLAALLVELFEARFDPAVADRDVLQAALVKAIEAGLEAVAILDEDRIIRSFLGLVQATLRTNAFQPDTATGAPKPYISFKLDPKRVPGMPAPRPLFEIWVYAPEVEAVHLRGGKVARGGIRWSDRREDFRTEVLGLMKAQMVKNSVIVPVGAKGGFFVKRPPAGGDRASLQDEAIRCYRTFLKGMLDITDNRVAGAIVPPASVVRHDGDDPYLVVAADKGTATFSDIANGVSGEYGFWLDDAFASGGSAGYDHKGMGITAKGAWESVRRHFRELGMDPDRDPFTCVGIGDMSGDVFGNGMLLSDKLKLVAAFDHRHVLIDPDPDAAASFAERQRLFALPRSSWADYAAGLLSKGGGIFARTAKSIQPSPEARTALGIASEGPLTPAELINAILKAPVDLLWNGGIGTYVKASTESHADAHDRANDPVRVDGRELRARVVGEGGNLGFTQRGRIEAAMAGVRLNTDFIDNSAGVDCSDHEVNIKILLNAVVAAGDMTLKQRDALLASMTDEVGALVLRDNVLQNLALSMGQTLGVRLLDAEMRLMRAQERTGRLDRGLELLPDDAMLEERRRQGQGLTRPERAVLLAYAKMDLYDRILASPLPDRSYFSGDLQKYFPRPLRRAQAPAIAAHGLKREIIATLLANSLVNRGLHVFVGEVQDDTGADLEEVALAFVIARDALGLLPLFAAVEAVPASCSPERQLELFLELRDVLTMATRWFLAHAERPITVRDVVGRFKPGIEAVLEGLDATLAPPGAATLAGRCEAIAACGIADGKGTAIARLPFLVAAADIVLVSHAAVQRGQSAPLERVARLYFALEDVLEIDWLKDRLRKVPVRSRWDRVALTSLEDQIAAALREITLVTLAAGLADGPRATVAAAVTAWLEREVAGMGAHRDLIAELRTVETSDLAMLSVATRTLAKLAAGRI